MSFYRLLLSVTVEHSFYLNGVCSCLNFYPTEKTLSVMERAGLLFKETIDGFLIAYDNSRLEALEMFAQDSLSFDFKAYSSNPDFKNYTEPFSAESDGIFIFDNGATIGPGRQDLGAPKHVSFEDLEKSELTECRQAKLTQLEKAGELNQLEAAEYGEILRQIKTLKGEDQLFRELNRILSRKDHLLPPELILRIHADNKQGSLLQQWLSPEQPTIYRIGFNSRKRYWKYYLLGKMVEGKNSNQGFYIDDADHKVEFETMDEETLSNQSLAYTFRSKQKIPLNERYSFQFQLKQKLQGAETVVIPRLPYASIRQLGKEEIANRKSIVSEIYINS